MVQNKVMSLLSIAAKGRKVVSGEYSVENAIRDGSAFLVIIALDVSGNTEKKFRNKCDFYHVPILQFGTKEELGHAIGKEFRASLAVVDEGLAKAIVKKTETHEE